MFLVDSADFILSVSEYFAYMLCAVNQILTYLKELMRCAIAVASVGVMVAIGRLMISSAKRSVIGRGLANIPS